MMSYSSGADSDEPLNVAKGLARAAGGSWVVFAPKPLDDVKRPTGDEATGMSSVEKILNGLSKAGTPLAWDTSKGYMLVDFASKDDLARIKTSPPIETSGVFMRGDTDDGMLKAFADIEHITITPDPALLQQRAAFRAARNEKSEDEPDNDQNPMSSYRRMMGQQPQMTDAPEFQVVAKVDLPGLLRHLGEYYGGEFTNTAGTQWTMRPLTDTAKIQSEIARLKEPIDASAANSADMGSSFSSRQHPQTQSDEERDQMEQAMLAQPLGDDIVSAFDTLGALGSPAIATLGQYLDVTKPQQAIAAVQTLGAMSQPEAAAALSAFQQKLAAPPAPGQSKAARAAIQLVLIRTLTKKGGPEAARLLTAAALDQNSTVAARRSARMKLLKMGDITPFEGPTTREIADAAPHFILPYPLPATPKTPAATPPQPAAAPVSAASTPKGITVAQVKDTNIIEVSASTDSASISSQAFTFSSGPGNTTASADPSHVTAIATTQSADGDEWAVFVSGYYGSTNDIWLAHGHNGQWIEFLFTGEQFASSQRSYGVAQVPAKGSCRMSVNGDSVVLSPPKGDPAARLEALRILMSNPKTPAAQRTKAINEYSQLQSNDTGSLSKALTYSLTTLRLDSDHDGLLDTVEKRLGTDPQKPDTDGDGLPDSKDANPLAGPASGDRTALLQTIFTGLYGGDKSTTPIVVILDKPNFQEFTGANCRVLCMTKDDYISKTASLAGCRLLQFTGPDSGEDTILRQDGPCLFNESDTKAEVHFFFIDDASSYLQLMSFASNQGTGMDYIAMFEHTSDWKLQSIKNWKFDSAMQSYTRYMQSQMMGSM